MFAAMKGKAVCLVCGNGVAVMKEYNVRRHYETKHHDRYKHLDMKQRLPRVKKKSGVTAGNVHKSQITKRGCCKG